jgi:hypothetical protein
VKIRTLLSAGVLTAAAVSFGPAAALATASSTLFVAPNGNNAGACTRSAPCRTIGHAVAAAHAGDSVLVAPGTYHEHVVIDKRLRLAAEGPGTLIDATGALNGIGLGIRLASPTAPQPVGNASGSTVSGFMIENATQEAIVALGSNLHVINNVIAHNDLGAHSAHPAGECAGQGQVPGDCGEGVHLAGVTHSVFQGNFVTGNQGGFLVSDEFGPTAYNLITHNTVVNNVPDCGITLPGHNSNALSASGHRQPARGGVYRNEIIQNAVNGNGAAGIGFFAGGPGTASYENLAEGNTISSSGIPGVAIHTHAPTSDTNGNHIIGNHLSRNGLGEGGVASPGDPDTPVNATTDIDVVADPGATPIAGTLIQNNQITNAHVGIWLVTRGGHTTLNGYRFENVQIPVRHS